jgi:lipocalin
MTALFLSAALAASAAVADLPVVDAVDLPRYMGTWYEIAHMPNLAQAGCTDTTVHYRLNRSGAFDLVNVCWKGAKYKPYRGVARRVEAGSSAKYRVKFLLFFGADYWIIDLDPGYRWAAVGTPKRDQLWIISRERTLDEGIYQGILTRARASAFDTGKLERTVVTGKDSQGFE